jgi:hypothetical protein
MIIEFLIASMIAKAEPHFDTGSTKPNPVLVEEIKKVCEQMEPDATVIIEGHTDLRGGDSYNLRLSKGRAESVKELLQNCQNKPKEIKTVGMGKNFPISANHDENRRVVIHMIQTNPKTIVVSEVKTEVKTEVVKVPIFVERRTKVIKKVVPEWHVTGFVSNGNYNLTTQRGPHSATVELERSWSGGVLVEKRVYENLYLGGGLTFDRQVMLGIGFGF